MLSVDDFHWTCLDINYPLVSFKFESLKHIEDTPKVTIDMIANLKTNKWYSDYALNKKSISYQEQKQLSKELFKYVKEMINGLR